MPTTRVPRARSLHDALPHGSAPDPPPTCAAPTVVRVSSPPDADVCVLAVTGDLRAGVAELRRRTLAALAEEPRGVVCDLGDVPVVPPSLLDAVASVPPQVERWPGTPVAVSCPGNDRLPGVYGSVQEATAGIGRGGHLAQVRATLAASALSARSARHFVTRTCLDWGLTAVIGPACLVASELVTNSVVHVGSDVTLSLTRHAGSLRVAVRDHSSRRPHLTPAHRAGEHGRGLALVQGFTSAWGVLPTVDDGKLVWAMLGLQPE